MNRVGEKASLDLYHCHDKLWVSDAACKLLNVDPDNTKIIKSFENKDVRIKRINNHSIPGLYKQLGAFVNKNYGSNIDVFSRIPGHLYVYREWAEFGDPKEENNVISFYHTCDNGKKIEFIFEPLDSSSKWRFINDPMGHRDNIGANCEIVTEFNDQNFPVISIKTISKINKNEQLFMKYGDDYWTKYKEWKKQQMYKKYRQMAIDMCDNTSNDKSKFVALFYYGIQQYYLKFPAGATESELIHFIGQLFGGISDSNVLHHLSQFIDKSNQ